MEKLPTTKRHAYLIMAYNNWRQLGMLLNLLDDPRNDIFVHIDLRSGEFPEQTLRQCVNFSGLTFIDRKNVYWADYSQTDVTLDLLEKASGQNMYHYYHLLSGMCLPLKTQDEIHSFFEQESREFVATTRSGGEYSKRYIAYYHLLLHNPYYRTCKPLKALDRLLMYGQKLVGVNRLKNRSMSIAAGWTWFSITDDFCRYLVQNRSVIREIFRNTIASDEHFVGTMAVNSSFANRLYDINDEWKNDYRKGCLRLIDWGRGRPYVWGTDDTLQDYAMLMGSEYLFARKFDEKVNFELIEMIYAELLRKQRS